MDAPDAPEAVHVQIDWQGHPAMHIPWWMFGRGLTDRALKHRRWRHQFRQTVTEPTLRDSGVRLFLAAAMAAERARNPEQARRLILEQLAYVEAFVAEHPDRYALARTPAEARELLATTDKLVFVHSIEGGHHLLWDPGDAAFWADRGVALVTLVHLRDDELGGSAILDKAVGPLINRRGARARRRGERRGLTELGASAMVALDGAGVLVDLTHMAPDTIEDALKVAAEHEIPPVFTHGKLQRLHGVEGALTDDQLVEVYRLGGVLALGLSGRELGPKDPLEPVPEDVCWDTLEAFAWHHDAVQRTLRERSVDILGTPWEALDEQGRIRLATGWSSDWNGWLSHSEPTKGCREPELDIDRRGLAHAGLLPQHWQRVEERGVDLDPMLGSAERFLQLWEQVRR
jgi:microsomal dipeptidase-like Zn-dependent dipeptidase